MEHFSNGAFLKWSISQMEQFSNGAFLKWSISRMEQFSNQTFLKWSISQMKQFSNRTFLKWSISQMEQFSNRTFLKWSNSQMEHFWVATLCHISRSQEQRNMACDVLGLPWTLAPTWPTIYCLELIFCTVQIAPPERVFFSVKCVTEHLNLHATSESRHEGRVMEGLIWVNTLPLNYRHL